MVGVVPGRPVRVRLRTLGRVSGGLRRTVGAGDSRVGGQDSGHERLVTDGQDDGPSEQGRVRGPPLSSTTHGPSDSVSSNPRIDLIPF